MFSNILHQFLFFFGVQSISLHPTNPLRIESNCGGKSRGCFKEKNNLLFFLYNCRLLPFSFFFLIYFYLLFFLCLTLI